MDLILVSMDWIRAKDNKRTLGHSSLLAHCIQKGIDVQPIHAAVNSIDFSKEDLFDMIVQHAQKNTVIALGVYVWNEHIVQWILTTLRLYGYTNTILLGGPQISYSSPGIESSYPQADVFVRGYGEEALVSLIKNPEQRFITGATFRGAKDTASVSNPELHRLTSPILKGVIPLHPFMRWETQRGCIYRCSFCQHREAGRLQQNQFSMHRIEGEIEMLSDGLVKDIAVLDPIFNNGNRETDIMTLLYTYGYRGHLSLQCRFESLTPDFLDVCSNFDVTLEFGLQTIHPDEMKAIHRRNNLRMISQKIQQLHERNIHFEVSLIYGLPNQTVDSFSQSVQWCLDQGIPSMQAFPLMLLRGTRLHEERSKWNLKESDDSIPVVTESDSFSYQEWLVMESIANNLHVQEQGAAK